jgi:tryptophan synthase alpha chain
MSRLSDTFERTRREGRIALMPYLFVGYPTVDATVELASALAEAGADIFELGVPYSDPLADGATIQHATHVALANGVTPRLCLEVASKIRQNTTVPIALMSYYNPIARYGDGRFCQDAARAGVDGLLVPDLPPEESDDLREAADRSRLDLSGFAAPTSTDERLRLVARAASGFVYCVALAGVTGARASLSEGLPAYLDRVRRFVDLPLAVGFGISRPEHVQVVAAHADGAIVASALIDRLDSLPPAERLSGATAYVCELARATKRPVGHTT